MKEATAILDRNVRKVISRKFLVFMIATVAFAVGRLNQDNWLIVAAIYIGVQGGIDFAALVRAVKGKSVQENYTEKP